MAGGCGRSMLAGPAAQATTRSRRRVASSCALALAVAAVIGCGRGKSGHETAIARALAPNDDLAAHDAEFKREVIEVTAGVHVAVGFGISNSILLEGDDAVIVVDTMESAEAARPVKEAFDRITTKPLAAIIYTHNHADHVFGAGVFAAGTKPAIYSHATLVGEVARIVNVVRPIIFERSMRQFGTYLPQSEHVSCGIGPRLINDATTTIAYLPPTNTFDGEQTEIEVAGVKMVLVHAPGETPDHIFVWLPEKRVLLPGDNFYESFPNLYAIRGTSYRDVGEWVRSLDKMRALQPAFLVPSHTRPVSGEDAIQEALTDYRDAIQFVHDQTVRWMNKGLTPDEIVERVHLPEHLADKPYLREYYGHVDWSVRSIFAGYLGWFGGDAVDLRPLARRAHAQRVVVLAGGATRVLDAARTARASGDDQWALELATELLLVDDTSVAAQARTIRADALRALAAREISANGRNYYLTQALETSGDVKIEPPDPSTAPDDLLRSFPVGNYLNAMAVNLDPEKAAGVDTVVGFRFPDTAEEYTLHVRHGVVEVAPHFPEAPPDMTVAVDSMVWKEILSRKRNAAAAIAKGDVKVDGGRIELVRFLLMFR